MQTAEPSIEEVRKLHEKQDTKNMIGTRYGRTVLLCGARRKRVDARCKQLAGMGTDHRGYGRCKWCGGASTGPKSAEGKEIVSKNARKHGFYSPAISDSERVVYEELRAIAVVDLVEEIYLVKAKILHYLSSWRRKWDGYYKRKLAEKYVKYKCTNPDCGREIVMSELSGKPGYCPASSCYEKHLEAIDSWVAERTPEEAEQYADAQTKVYYSEGEGARSYYHAGSLEDRTLDRALNTLGRLVEKHARLTQESGDDLLSRVNKELQEASQGKITVSWSGKPQTRESQKTRNGGT